jgi:hypothetical protein
MATRGATKRSKRRSPRPSTAAPTDDFASILSRHPELELSVVRAATVAYFAKTTGMPENEVRQKLYGETPSQPQEQPT